MVHEVLAKHLLIVLLSHDGHFALNRYIPQNVSKEHLTHVLYFFDQGSSKAISSKWWSYFWTVYLQPVDDKVWHCSRKLTQNQCPLRNLEIIYMDKNHFNTIAACGYWIILENVELGNDHSLLCLLLFFLTSCTDGLTVRFRAYIRSIKHPETTSSPLYCWSLSTMLSVWYHVKIFLQSWFSE